MLVGYEDRRTGRAALPALAVFGALAVGLALGRYGPAASGAVWFSVAAAACACAGLLRGRACRAALGAAGIAFGAGWFVVRFHEPASGGLAAIVGRADAGDAILTVEGVVLDAARSDPAASDPLVPYAGVDGRTRWTLAVESVVDESGPVPVSGRLWVRIGGPPVSIGAGTRVRITGRVSPVPAPMNPGEPDRRLWAVQEGFAGTLRAPGADLVQRVDEAPSVLARVESAWLSWRAAARERARRLLLGDDREGLPPRRADEPGNERAASSRALLAALLLGEEEPAAREVRSAFTRLGLAHVMAISGFHLAVLAAVALSIVRLTGDRGALEPAIVGGLILLYLVVVPFNAPVWRSVLMVLAILASRALGRRYDPLAVLAWVGVALVLWRPLDLWSIGFQLSFGLVAVLFWLEARFRDRLFGETIVRMPGPPGAWGVARDWFKSAFSANTLCCLAAMPLVMFHTGLVSPLAVLTGVIVLPPIVAILYLGYAALVVGIVVPGAAEAASWVLEGLASATVWLVTWLDSVPGTSLRAPAVSWWWAGLATLVMLYLLGWARRREPQAWVAAAFLAAWMTVEIGAGTALPKSVALRVDTLAVGDGTCHLVRSGREALLWDCGSMTPGVGRLLVPRAVRALGSPAVGVAVISHPNLDHFNGLPDAADPLGVRTILVGEAFMAEAARRPYGGEAYALERLRSRGVDVRIVAAGDSLKVGEATVRFISPPPGAIWPEANDRSLVAILEAPLAGGRTRRLLLTGDIQARAIEAIRASMPDLRADAMEAPHHGSVRPAAMDFVLGVSPSIVLQSTGPSRAADERWAHVRRGRAWWTTAIDGAAWVEFLRDGQVKTGAFLAEGE